MSALAIAAGLFLAPAPSLAVDQVDVAYEDLAASRNAAAVERIESNPELDQNHPARLINLGTAYARQGETDVALELFRQALRVADLKLETATGEWIGSHALAQRAIDRLAPRIDPQTRTALR